jgi:hypothetical protein
MADCPAETLLPSVSVHVVVMPMAGGDAKVHPSLLPTAAKAATVAAPAAAAAGSAEAACHAPARTPAPLALGRDVHATALHTPAPLMVTPLCALGMDTSCVDSVSCVEGKGEKDLSGGASSFR